MIDHDQPTTQPFLPSLSLAYKHFYQQISQDKQDQRRLKHYMIQDQYSEQRAKIESEIGSKLLQLIIWDLSILSQKCLKSECIKIQGQMMEKLRQQYGQNISILFSLLGKVFHYQEYNMLKSIKEDIEILLLQLRYDQVSRTLPQIIVLEHQEKSFLSEDCSSFVSKYIDDQSFIEEIQLKEDSTKYGTNLCSDYDVSYSRHPSQQGPVEEFENNNQEQAAEQAPSMPAQSAHSLAQQIQEYLSTINYYKSQLGQFCQQFSLSKPIYTEMQSKPSPKMMCTLNFTSSYTKYHDRKYQSLGTAQTKLKAQEQAAKKILKVIYKKHSDMWEKFRAIKKQRNFEF